MAGHYFNTVIDAETGKPVSGAVVKVYTSAAVISGNGVSSGSFETIFSDDGVTSIDQAGGSYVTTNSRGFFEFWTDADQVVYEVLFAGTALFAVSDVEVYDGADANDVTGVTTRLDNLDALLGTSANDTTLGTFTGSIITDNVTVSAALQELETDLTYGGVAAGDPGGDRIPVWDDTAGAMEWSTVLYTEEDAGNVGIGTTTPSASYGRNLHIHDGVTTSGSIKITHTTSGTTATDGLELIFSGVNAFVQNREAGFLSFGTSNSERVRIDSAGNVGIANNSPSEKLDVTGNAEVSGTIKSNSIDVLTESLVIACSDESTAITTTGTKLTFRMPFAMTVTGVRASLGGACTTGTFTVDINEGGTTILSTKLTIDATEKTSTTAATAAVISDSALADDAEITIDVDNVGDSTATGLKVTLIGTRA